MISSVSGNLKPQDKSQKALMIVDMQERFLPNPNETRSSEYAKARKCLVENILSRIQEYRNMDCKIILIKYEWGWDIDPEIDKAAKSWEAKEILKYHESLLDDMQGHISKRIANILRGYWDCGFEIVWINATICIMKTAISLLDNWFGVSVNPKCVMDCFPLNIYDWDSFLKRNTLRHVHKTYRNQNTVYNLDFSVKRIRNVWWLLGFGWEKNKGETYLWDL